MTKYDFAANGDLVLIAYTGTRGGNSERAPERPESLVSVIGAKADLLFDDARKEIKLTNFRR